MRSRKANWSSIRLGLLAIHQMFSQNIFPASVLGQHLPRLNFFKVNSKGSVAKQVQFSSKPQSTSTSSTSTPATLSVLMFSFSKNYDAQEELRLRWGKLQGVSEGFSHLLVSSRERRSKRFSRRLSCSLSSSCHSSRFRSSREDQGTGVALMESESVVHGQQPPPPQQNQESQESTSQWRSQRIRSCFSESVSLSSASWRKNQNQERNQEKNQSTTITSLSASIKSYVICFAPFILLQVCHLSFFCRFVIFLFSCLHPSSQSSVQSLSAQPYVTASIPRATARLALDSLESLLSPSSPHSSRSLTSVIMSMATTQQVHAQGSSGRLSGVSSSAESNFRRCGHVVSGSHHSRQQSISRSSRVSASSYRSRVVRAQDLISWRPRILLSNLCSSHVFRAQGWTWVTCQMTSSTLCQASRVQMAHSTSRGSWRLLRIAIAGTSLGATGCFDKKFHL